ncbi:hypothetical protein B0H11DRAFT_1931256 [Mycena galericulata]|nr:hypothetical protein B0H11DRAFT_1931256 [Mycena galericulata]
MPFPIAAFLGRAPHHRLACSTQRAPTSLRRGYPNAILNPSSVSLERGLFWVRGIPGIQRHNKLRAVRFKILVFSTTGGSISTIRYDAPPPTRCRCVRHAAYEYELGRARTRRVRRPEEGARRVGLRVIIYDGFFVQKKTPRTKDPFYRAIVNNPGPLQTPFQLVAALLAHCTPEARDDQGRCGVLVPPEETTLQLMDNASQPFSVKFKIPMFQKRRNGCGGSLFARRLIPHRLLGQNDSRKDNNGVHPCFSVKCTRPKRRSIQTRSWPAQTGIRAGVGGRDGVHDPIDAAARSRQQSPFDASALLTVRRRVSS